jgi:hypothetical protein
LPNNRQLIVLGAVRASLLRTVPSTVIFSSLNNKDELKEAVELASKMRVISTLQVEKSDVSAVNDWLAGASPIHPSLRAVVPNINRQTPRSSPWANV